MYYTKCTLERCESKFASGGTGQFREEWIPSHYAAEGNLLTIEDDIPWVVTKVGTSTTIIKYVEKLNEQILDRFKSKLWYEALKTRKLL